MVLLDSHPEADLVNPDPNDPVPKPWNREDAKAAKKIFNSLC